jgi:hypothetical protein
VGDKIQNIDSENGTVSAWAAVPGMTETAAAASDPAVINVGPDHILLFYRDIQGDIRFTERQSGVWREKPLVLSDSTNSNYGIYLPLVVKAMAGSSGQSNSTTEQDPVSRDLEPEVSPSQLSAASRNDNHAAVFYVDGENRLWVNEWTNLNESDWSDTHWRLLMENVMIEKPAVASRHINHLAVAVRDTTGAAYIIEWTPDLNDTGEAGWKEPYSLGQIPSGTLAGPLALASTSVDKLSVYGADGDGTIWHREWQAPSSWSGWEVVSDFPGNKGMGDNNEKTITTVVRRTDDIMLLWRYIDLTSGSWMYYQHLTSTGITPTQTEIVPAGVTQGYPRGQAQAWVDGQTLWVTAHAEAGSSPEYWQVDARVLGTNDPPVTPVQLRLTEGNHLYTDGALVYAAAADLDFDGNDEVVVATDYTPTGHDTTISIFVFKFGINPDQSLSVVVLATQQIATTKDEQLSFSLALDDLNADGIKNELVLAYKKLYDPTMSAFQLSVYQYDIQTHALVQKAATNLPLVLNYSMENYAGAQVEVGTGRFYSTLPGRQIVVSNLDVYYLSGYFWKFPTVRTYKVDISSSDWTITQVNQDNEKNEQITQKYWWMELAKGDGDYTVPGDLILSKYSSALDTGDLDADGYDEIALGYSNQVIVVDPGGATATDKVKIVPFDSNWLYSIGPDRSLAVGDIDRDGRAEILSEMYMQYFPAYTPKFNLFEMMGDGSLKRTSTFDLPSVNAGGSLNTILIADVDHDSFLSELTGCEDFVDVKIVAVLNGAPRWYANGQPINESRGTYSVIGENTSSEETGTKFNLGASLTFGFEQEINIPVTGINAGEVRASVTTDFMSSQGIRQSTETYQSWSTGLGFEQLSLGEVVYESVSYTCYYYDVYDPAAPADKSKAMVCIPGAQSAEKTKAISLEHWRTDIKQTAGMSWADVGHIAPDGTTYSNNLAIAGNYPSSLPVDDYMLVYKGNPVTVRNDVPGQGVEWSYTTGTTEARTLFHEMELNTTFSVGGSVFAVTTDKSVTTGVGHESSQSMSWGNKLAFYGKIYQLQDSARLCYTLVPFVYQAKALTKAGVTYHYWEMDYYVTSIWQCNLQNSRR